VGFESDDNEVEMVTRAGQIVHAGPASKTEIAGKILDQIATLRLSLRSAELLISDTA
jgi:phosphopantothenoylcysteine synthetase/decarboxylase